MKFIFRFLFKIILAGIFMNFGFPEMIYQYNKFEFSDGFLEQIKNIDVNDLQSNLNKMIDKNGDFIVDNINSISIKKEGVSKVKEVKKHTQPKIISTNRNNIISESKKHIGIPYSYGDEDPINGFDCSGFTWYVYKKSINYNLPRNSRQQFSTGGGNFVNFNQLKPGDLMFFSDNGRQITHVAIFLDQYNFIHAPRTGRRISIEAMNRYWQQRFVKGKTYLL